MKFMDELKICGLLGLFTGVTLADVELIVKIAVGLATFVYIVLKIVKVCKGKGGSNEG